MSLLTLAAVLWFAGLACLVRDLWVPRGLTDVRYRTLTVLALAGVAISLYAVALEDYLSAGIFVAFVVGVILVAHARFLAYRDARLARERLRQERDADRRQVVGGPVVTPFMRVPAPGPIPDLVDPAEVARIEAAARAELEAGKGAMGRMFGS